MNNKIQTTLITLALLTNVSDVMCQDRVTDKLLKKFDQLIQGEFDNYNQYNFENNSFLDESDLPKKKHARLYKHVARINAPSLGKFVYYHQIHEGGKDKPIYRQSLQVVTPDHNNNTIVAQNYRFNSPESFTNLWQHQNEISLSLSDLKLVGENCHSTYKAAGETFIGGIDPKQCKVESKKGGYIYIATEQVVSQLGLWHLEEGYSSSGKEIFGREDNIPHKMRRAKKFKCWAAFKTKRLKENGEPHWDFYPNRIVHNQGDISEFSTTDREPEQYFIRLKETTFPAGSRPDVFELFIHENTEQARKNYKQALSYTWTNKEAERLGINLRWMQASCSVVDSTS